ncbi:MAG: hypothetical protein ACYC35_24860, partial [Pirellulales bacterium]
MRSRLLLSALALYFCILGSGANAQTTATWIAGDGNYGTAGNWDINVVPINDATNTYKVVIPAGKTIAWDDDGVFDVTDFVLGADSTFNVGSGTTLQVLDEASIAGIINTSNGHFRANTAGATVLSGGKVRFGASNSGTIHVAADAYDTRGIVPDVQDWTEYYSEVLQATGPGSVLDLSSVQSLNAGFDDGRYQDYNIHRISAKLGGTVNLSGVKTITAPVRYEDRLDFLTSGGGSINLSGLTTITSAGSGRVR